ncbi:hypothetical protein ACJ73_08997 [Blastomyces percursus]|uniref:Uncharacterized protein n=1 Tax=Blastomyces percursus TaxID=1658174 RepID=A0A1J9QGC8_9EURO|nr:hypothetical protein ACJ73_08997 [Blastomyces percursus]
MDLKARLPHKAKAMQETRQSNASKHSPNDSSRAQGKSKSESESDGTDDECAVTDGSDFENDTQSLQKQTSILSMKLKGQKCPKTAQPLRRYMLASEMTRELRQGMLTERQFNKEWCVGT